jgi:hypothetical protein
MVGMFGFWVVPSGCLGSRVTDSRVVGPLTRRSGSVADIVAQDAQGVDLRAV